MSEEYDTWFSYEAWIEQAGMAMASAGGEDEGHVRREIMHYAAVYGQDGPVTVHGPMLVEWRMFPDVDEPVPVAPPEYAAKFSPTPETGR